MRLIYENSKLPRGSPSKEELEELEAEMYRENDRTFVIMLVSFLEDALGAFILKLLRNNLTSDERSALFDYHGPLGTFSSQIAVAYAVRLIGPITRNDLEIIKTIRNGVAHTRRKFTFSLLEVMGICKFLKTPDVGSKWIDVRYIETITGKRPEIGDRFDDNSAKTKFAASVHTITMNMINPVEPRRVAMVIPYQCFAALPFPSLDKLMKTFQDTRSSQSNKDHSSTPASIICDVISISLVELLS